ncbi:MAG: preprotein translocase subunit SecE [Salinivirgaceae bacterium]|nr:preprotein translocase subunit SecE [Salinivirgaceae bacterium]
MDIAKLFRRKIEGEPDRYTRNKRPEALKKGGQRPAKPKKADGARKPRKADGARFNWLSQFRQYLREVVYELRKVVWPSRKETISSTSVVLVIVILSGIFLGIVDLLLSRFVRLLIG